eukprot:CAMPEP_0183778186 /NCGR_PEP_ID=MMETSP0739-20130205/50889_1 /TAXON_ID=385413 /ORGANISM="Thalassiosira miniscula, Strain CCMP1093" /LENGTH=61 /DNA_ID=CAMNT_0026020505 /DNA_START=351 /DNA_END=536 /DNA_ORIENTATION=+
MAHPPIQTSSPIEIGRVYSVLRLSMASNGCVAVYNCTPGARNTLSPMVIAAQSSRVQLKLA